MDEFLSENKVLEEVGEKRKTGVGESVGHDVENHGSKGICKKRFMLSEYNDYVPDFSVYEPLRPSEAVRAMCKQCCVYSTHEARKCVSKSCPLWLLRKRYFKC